jgi:hypothetical protein
LRIAWLCHQGILPATRLRHGFADAGVVRIFLKHNQSTAIRAVRVVSAAEILKSLVEKISAARAMNFDFFDHSRVLPENGRVIVPAGEPTIG